MKLLIRKIADFIVYYIKKLLYKSKIKKIEEETAKLKREYKDEREDIDKLTDDFLAEFERYKSSDKPDKM